MESSTTAVPYDLPSYADVDALGETAPLPRTWTLPEWWELVADRVVRHRRTGRLLALHRRMPWYGYDEAKGAYVHLESGRPKPPGVALVYERGE